MKKSFILIVFSILFSLCRSQKEISIENGNPLMKILQETTDMDGFLIKKRLVIEPGRKLELKKDDIGKYYVVKEKGEKNIVSLIVEKKPEKPIADAAVSYSVTFELPNPVKPGEWNNGDLKNIQAVYGFLAFHPKSGYYPLKQGTIRIKILKQNLLEIHITLPDQYSQMLNGDYTLKIKPEK